MAACGSLDELLQAILLPTLEPRLDEKTRNISSLLP